jgi:hypothetical protein
VHRSRPGRDIDGIGSQVQKPLACVVVDTSLLSAGIRASDPSNARFVLVSPGDGTLDFETIRRYR